MKYQSPAPSPITGNHTIWDSDGEGIAKPHLNKPEVEHPLHLLQSLTMTKGSTTQTGEAKASIVLVVNLELWLTKYLSC